MHKTLITPWYEKTVKALQIAGMSERTQECYARAVRMLIEHYEKDPRKITEDELQDYFLYRRNTSKWAPATLRICYSGLKFFFINVIQKDWHIFSFLKAQNRNVNRKLTPCDNPILTPL